MIFLTRLWVRRWGLAVGIGLSFILAVLFGGGAFHRLDDFNFDQHFRRLGTLSADPRVVLIDIDDHALETIDRWPWPRRRLAELVDTLHELGAKSIVLDLILSEPSTPRTEHAGLGKHYDVDTALVERGDRRSDPIIYDDDELRDSMKRAGNVYLAMLGGITAANATPPIGGDFEKGLLGHAGHLAEEYLARNPDRSFPMFLADVAPELSETFTPEREALLVAFRAESAIQTILQRQPPIDALLAELLPSVNDVTPPLDKFARAARGVGLVMFDRESSGGVLRATPLLYESHGRLFAQLGMQIALDVLGLTPVGHVGRTIELQDGLDVSYFGVDEWGSTILNWHRPQVPDRWQDSFTQIPVARLMEIPSHRRSRLENGRRLQLSLASMVQLRHADTLVEYEKYIRMVNDPPSAGMKNAVEEEALTWLRRAWFLWQDTQPKTDEERTEKETIRRLHAQFVEGDLSDRVRQGNRKLDERVAELSQELRPQIDGKICLVGYTASAVADLVATPIYTSMPGVMAHANIINMVLQSRFPVRASPGANIALLLAAGIIVSVFTCLRGPWLGLFGMFIVFAAALAAGAVLFYAGDIHMASFSVMATAVVVWAGVTLYRQFVEERSRRQFQRALSQYTSPAVAAQIAQNAGPADLAPQASMVTCFFSDLSGFTRISEQLGAAQTRDVLNPYLREVSRVLHDRRGLVNKFIGDGVFGFFNAPIHPCSRHAEAGCESALEVVRRVRALNPYKARQNGYELSVRIGLSTGEAFVGDYGSETKLDYTCIGDTVNVASRLESANKSFGTAILVDAATRAEVGPRFAFRSLGRILVPGRSQPVETYELIGYANEVTDDIRRSNDLLEQAIGCFQTQQWDACLGLLDQYHALAPQDRIVECYRRAVEAARSVKIEAEWPGAVDPFRTGVG